MTFEAKLGALIPIAALEYDATADDVATVFERKGKVLAEHGMNGFFYARAGQEPPEPLREPLTEPQRPLSTDVGLLLGIANSQGVSDEAMAESLLTIAEELRDDEYLLFFNIVT